VGEWDLRRVSPWGGSALFDEDERMFKMWYFGESALTEGINWDRASTLGAIGYAWSQDGMVWHKPALGLYEYRDSKRNNIVFRCPTGIKHYGRVDTNMVDHFSMAKDYRAADPTRRYAGWAITYYPTEDRNRVSPVYSPDGIHWTVGPRRVVGVACYDRCNFIVDDDDPNPDRRLKFYGILTNLPLGHRDMFYGPDVEHCEPSPFNPIIEPAGGLEHTVQLFAVSRYQGYYIMLYDYNFRLDYYGQKGQCDSGFLVTSQPIVHGDTIYIFCSACDEASDALPHDNVARIGSSCWTGLATLPLDRFTHLQSRDGYGPGIVTTVPITVQ
jgi:hypothetical protein